jgi:hypothetical protein
MIIKHPLTWTILALIAMFGVAGVLGDRHGQQPERHSLDRAKDARDRVVEPPPHSEPKREEWRQEQDLQAQWEMAYWAKYAAIAGFFSALVTAVGIWFVRQTLDANRSAVVQASAANKISRDTLIASERPWVAVQYKPVSDLVFDQNGMHFTVEFHVRNTGKSPARYVWVTPEMLVPVLGVDPPYDARALQRRVFEGMKAQTGTTFGFALFPDERIAQHHLITLAAPQLDRIRQSNGIVRPFVYGAVAYRTTFDTTAVHLTSFSFDVVRGDEGFRKRPDGQEWKADTIFIDEGNVPAEKLAFQRSFLGEEYAD